MIVGPAGVGVGAAVGMGVGLGVSVGRGVVVGRGGDVGLGVSVGLGVGVGWGTAVGYGVAVGRGVFVGPGVEVGNGVFVGRGLAVGIGVGIGVEVVKVAATFASTVASIAVSTSRVPRIPASTVAGTSDVGRDAVSVPAGGGASPVQAISARPKITKTIRMIILIFFPQCRENFQSSLSTGLVAPGAYRGELPGRGLARPDQEAPVSPSAPSPFPSVCGGESGRGACQRNTSD